jgi:hypothetical protein
MTNLSASNRSQIYTELAAATSPKTAEALMQSAIDTPWDKLVTTDHLDARFAQVDARFAQVDTRFAQVETTIERSLRKQTFWLMSAMFAFNGLLATWITAFG